MSLRELKQESVFWSKLGFCYDPPRLDRNGNPIVFYDREKSVRYHKQMYDAGIRIHSTLLFSGWIGDGVYDYAETDRTLDAIFSCGPELRYIPRIKLNVPLDWGKTHPEDMLVYYDGPRDADGVRGLVNTPRHDILGYEADGYFAIGFKDDRINRGGLIGNQSFSSAQWKKDASEALRRVIRLLEDGPYGDRIAGYHIAYGNCGETCLWGGFNGSLHCGDYGISNRKAFFDWGMEKYGTLEKLRQAWNNPGLSRENVEPPSPELREGHTMNSKRFFRALPEDLICVDYDQFMSEMNANALECFGQVAKEASRQKPFGVFYGYYMNIPRSAYNGHLAYDRVLNSPHIDFIASPAGYYKRDPGEPGGEQVCAQSINRKKIFLDELDNRTHLAVNGEGAENADATASVLWREFAKNLMYGSNYWWMDLGGGWFDSEDILAIIQKTEKTAQALRKQPARSIAQVLIVSDENAFFFMRSNAALHTDLLKETVTQLHLCGTPVDHYRLSDLKELDLTQYKLIVFLNAFHFPYAEWECCIARIPEKTSLMFFYVPDHAEQICGTLLESYDPKGETLEFIADEAFGVKFHETYERKDHLYPLFLIRERDNMKVLARYADGSVAACENKIDGRNVICCALPLLKAPALRRIMDRCGVEFYGPLDSTVYGDDRFCGVFAAKNVSLPMPEKDEIIVKSNEKSAYSFYIKIKKGSFDV